MPSTSSTPDSDRNRGPRRVLVAGCLALLVITAGCNGLLGFDGETTPDADSSLDPATVPGVDTNDSVDANRLASAHADTLSNRSFTAEQRVVVRGANGSILRETHSVSRMAANRTRYRFEQTIAGPAAVENDRNATVRLFADGQRAYRSLRVDERTQQELVRGADGEPLDPRAAFGPQPTLRNRIELVLGVAENTSVSATDDSVTITGTADGSALGPMSRDLRAVENGTVSVTVAPNGRVIEYTIAYDARLDDESVRVRETVAIFGVGETNIVRPAWVAEITEEDATTEDRRLPPALTTVGLLRH
ncbi:hypothetical protein [Salinirubrum litoreum]|uniref:Outer membrane lipoprotein-sorting protein n=1 Tax=Salinirubrum litoreum TaxID=1126234 RepID=A0ABD5RAI1_9EURY|nr:hypothetical protein [Salinirubrum litoreum]